MQTNEGVLHAVKEGRNKNIENVLKLSKSLRCWRKQKSNPKVFPVDFTDKCKIV